MSIVVSTGVDSAAGQAIQEGVEAGPPAELRVVSGIPWSDRFNRATARYRPLTAGSDEHLEDVAAGIEDWASILPQTDQSPSGHFITANTWGLGPELSELRVIIIQLKLHGCRDIAEELKFLADDLKTTAHRLDECYPKSAAAHESAEKRLVGLARNQATRLADLLRQLKVDMRRVQPAQRPDSCGDRQRTGANRQPAQRAVGGRAAGGPRISRR